MAVSNTFSANTQIKSAQLNTNFTECVSPFTDWATWTPTYSASTGTWTGISGVAQWCQMGKIVFIQITAYGTTSASTDSLFFTLPVTPANDSNDLVGGGCVSVESVAEYAGAMTYLSSGVRMEVRRYDRSVYSAGANMGVIASFHYKVS